MFAHLNMQIAYYTKKYVEAIRAEAHPIFSELSIFFGSPQLKTLGQVDSDDLYSNLSLQLWDKWKVFALLKR